MSVVFEKFHESTVAHQNLEKLRELWLSCTVCAFEPSKSQLRQLPWPQSVDAAWKAGLKRKVQTTECEKPESAIVSICLNIRHVLN